MMAKITKGRDFGGAVRYVTQDKKDAKILDSKGVLTTDKQSIINSFRLQCQLRPDVKVMVGHISIDFSVEDVDKMSDDFMVKVAQDYLQKMNILNTQYIIARHFDREHPHCHLVFNRIDNSGHLISNKNDRIRSAKICKELTAKYGLHMAHGKDHVHRERLRGADAVKYQIYDALLAERPYWATKVWPIKAFRWIHDKRYWWIWVIYLLFTLLFSLSICNSVFQRRKIVELQDTQMKYRFIKAMGFAPNAVQFLEDAYEEGQRDRIDYVEKTVSDYEKALKHKADGITRAERKKLERF